MQRYLDAGIVTPQAGRAASAIRSWIAWPPAASTPRECCASAGPARRPSDGALRADVLGRLRRCTWREKRSCARSPAPGFNVIVKLHDRSLDPDPRYNGGIDWRARFAALAETALDASGSWKRPDASPLLAAADVHGHRPQLRRLRVPRPRSSAASSSTRRTLRARRAINPDKIALLRSAATRRAHARMSLAQQGARDWRDPGAPLVRATACGTDALPLSGHGHGAGRDARARTARTSFDDRRRRGGQGRLRERRG